MSWWIANGIGATLAVPANLWCMVGATRPVRRARAIVAVIAAVYASGIWWGVINDRLEDWAKAAHGVDLAAWLVVWIWPPIAVRLERERLARTIKAMRDVGEAGR